MIVQADQKGPSNHGRPRPAHVNGKGEHPSAKRSGILHTPNSAHPNTGCAGWEACMELKVERVRSTYTHWACYRRDGIQARPYLENETQSWRSTETRIETNCETETRKEKPKSQTNEGSPRNGPKQRNNESMQPEPCNENI
jgi:hypothetical protein